MMSTLHFVAGHQKREKIKSKVSFETMLTQNKMFIKREIKSKTDRSFRGVGKGKKKMVKKKHTIGAGGDTFLLGLYFLFSFFFGSKKI